MGSTRTSCELISDLLAHYRIIWVWVISRTESIWHSKALKDVFSCNLRLYIFSVEAVWKLMDVVIWWVETESICVRFRSQLADVHSLIIWKSARNIIPIIFIDSICVRIRLIFLRVQTFISLSSIWSLVAIEDLFGGDLSYELLFLCDKVNLGSLTIESTTVSILSIEWKTCETIHINTIKAQTGVMILMHLARSHQIILTVQPVARWVLEYLWNLLFLVVIFLGSFSFRKASWLPHRSITFHLFRQLVDWWNHDAVWISAPVSFLLLSLFKSSLIRLFSWSLHNKIVYKIIILNWFNYLPCQNSSFFY